jgi:hypothetical protein
MLALAYEPSLDQAGHLTGPVSPLVDVSTRCSSDSYFTNNVLLGSVSCVKLTSSLGTFMTRWKPGT